MQQGQTATAGHRIHMLPNGAKWMGYGATHLKHVFSGGDTAPLPQTAELFHLAFVVLLYTAASCSTGTAWS